MYYITHFLLQQNCQNNCHFLVVYQKNENIKKGKKNILKVYIFYSSTISYYIKITCKNYKILMIQNISTYFLKKKLCFLNYIVVVTNVLVQKQVQYSKFLR